MTYKTVYYVLAYKDEHDTFMYYKDFPDSEDPEGDFTKILNKTAWYDSEEAARTKLNTRKLAIVNYRDEHLSELNTYQELITRNMAKLAEFEHDKSRATKTYATYSAVDKSLDTKYRNLIAMNQKRLQELTKEIAVKEALSGSLDHVKIYELDAVYEEGSGYMKSELIIVQR